MMTGIQDKPQEPGLLDPLKDILQDAEMASTYLTHRIIGQMMLELRRARRRAGLSQTDVAERMNTRQPSIARLEGDQMGSVTLHRYVEYMVACDAMLLDPEVADLERVRRYLLHDPSASAESLHFRAWLARTLLAESEPVPEKSHDGVMAEEKIGQPIRRLPKSPKPQLTTLPATSPWSVGSPDVLPGNPDGRPSGQPPSRSKVRRSRPAPVLPQVILSGMAA